MFFLLLVAAVVVLVSFCFFLFGFFGFCLLLFFCSFTFSLGVVFVQKMIGPETGGRLLWKR